MQHNYLKLLDIMKHQAETIKEQSTFVDTLVNENMEKENMINEILKDIEES